MKVQRFDSLRKFVLGTTTNEDKQPFYVKYNRRATINLKLNIHHSQSLVYRNVPWLVSREDMNDLLLEALGFNTKKVIEASSDKFEGDVDV